MKKSIFTSRCSFQGCTNPAIYEAVVPLLSQFTLFLDLAVVDPSQSLGFPLNVVALLPYMLLHYEDANELCISSAENIALVIMFSRNNNYTLCRMRSIIRKSLK